MALRKSDRALIVFEVSCKVKSAFTDQMTTVKATNAKTDGYAAIADNSSTSDIVVKLVGVVA